VRSKGYIPERGDLIWLNFAPQKGREQAGKRPALVISPSSYNRKTQLAVCCPLTRQVKGYPFEVLLPQGLKVEGAILSDHVKSLDWAARKASFICRVTDPILEEVQGKLLALLTG
jgi:mRNA interferase MazF